MGLSVIDANAKPPVPGALELGIYSRGGVLSSRINRAQPLDPAFVIRSFDTFRTQQKRAGVRFTLIHAKANGPGFDPLGPHETLSNEAVAATVRELPGEFAGLATFDPVRDPAAGDGAQAALDDGFRGIALQPGYMPQPTTCNDRRLAPVYEVCAARGVPVAVLAGGFAGPDLSWSDPVHIDRLAQDFPQLKIIVTHGGFPFVQQAVGLLYRRENVWLMPDMYFPTMPGEDDYRAALASYASERFLFSSAYPLCPVRDQLDRLLRLDLPGNILDRYLYRNAMELFGLDDLVAGRARAATEAPAAAPASAHGTAAPERSVAASGTHAHECIDG